MIRVQRGGLSDKEPSSSILVMFTSLELVINQTIHSVFVYFTENIDHEVHLPQVLHLEFDTDFPKDYLRATLLHIKTYLSQKKFRYDACKISYGGLTIGCLNKPASWKLD